jgi:hypothetical protein
MMVTSNISILPSYGDKERFIKALAEGFQQSDTESKVGSLIDIDDDATQISDDKTEVVAVVRWGIDNDSLKALSIYLDSPVFVDEYGVDEQICCSAVMAHKGEVHRADFAEDMPIQEEDGLIDMEKSGELIDATSEKAGNALEEFKAKFVEK